MSYIFVNECVQHCVISHFTTKTRHGPSSLVSYIIARTSGSLHLLSHMNAMLNVSVISFSTHNGYARHSTALWHPMRLQWAMIVLAILHIRTVSHTSSLHCHWHSCAFLLEYKNRVGHSAERVKSEFLTPSSPHHFYFMLLFKLGQNHICLSTIFFSTLATH
jgi:hypothetical protein